MNGQVRQTIERYCTLANCKITDLRPVATPNIDDHSLQESDFIQKGELTSQAAKIVLYEMVLHVISRSLLSAYTCITFSSWLQIAKPFKIVE